MEPAPWCRGPGQLLPILTSKVGDKGLNLPSYQGYTQQDRENYPERDGTLLGRQERRNGCFVAKQKPKERYISQ